MTSERLSLLQLAMLVTLSRVTVTLVYFPEGHEPAVKQDLWITTLLGSVLGVALAWIASRVWVRFPALSFAEVLEQVLGRAVGKAVMLVYVMVLMLGVAVNLRLTGEFVVFGFLPRTPLVVVTLVAGILSVWAARAGLEVMGRAAQLLIMLVVGSAFLVCLLLAKDIRYANLQPVLLETGLPIHLQQAWSVAIRNTEWIWVGLAIPSLAKPQSVFRALAGAHLAQAVIWIPMAIAVAGLISPFQGALYFPFFTIARMISVADFLERLDAIVLSTWMFGMFMRTGLFLWGAAAGVSQVLGLKDYRPLVAPLGVIGLTYSFVQAESLPELMSYLGAAVFTPFILTFSVLLPLAVLVVAMLRRMKGAKGEAR